MKMKCSKSFVIVVAVLVISAEFTWRHIKEVREGPVLMVPADEAFLLLPKKDRPKIPRSMPFPPNLWFQKRANELTEAEKVGLTNLFVTKLKPAAEKWASVYSNRVPFDLADLTMDKFVNRVGRDYYSYSFVIGDITFNIAEQNGTAQVQFLANGSAVMAVASLPTTDVAPDLSMPVTREQVLALAEADSGVQYPSKECKLEPSAESGSLAGGAIVDVGSEVLSVLGRPISKSSTGFTYVFAKDGTLAYYLRVHQQ
jgi:hypothetical protein